MMRASFLTRFAVVPLTMSLALAIRQEPTFDLTWHPKTDDALSYKMRFEIESNPEKFAFVGHIKSRVVKVKPNGDYDVETSIKDAHVLHGTHDDTVPNDDKATIDTYNAKGQKISSSEDNDASEQANPGFNTLDAVTDQLSPKDPVAIGGTWSSIIKPNAKQKREAARVNYTLIGKVKEGAYPALKIEYKYRETEKDHPVTAEGYVLVSQDDFSLVRFEGAIKGAKFSDDADFPSGDATLSVVRD